MPELRKDPIVGRWVIISTERARRPSDFTRPREARRGTTCAFCAGRESETPPEVLAFRSDGGLPNTGNWTVRVVPNKFPALRIEGELAPEGEGIFDRMNGIGAHEVVVETPDHNADLAQLTPKQIEEVLWAYRERLVDLQKDPRFRYVLIFKNHGADAGASLEHTHSQLIALPIIPLYVAEELNGAREYYRHRERCVFCDLVRQELASKTRLVAETEDFVTLCPFAPRFPFETWILPKRHGEAFERATEREYRDLAGALGNLLRRMNTVLDSPPYNYVIHSSPAGEPDDDSYHWHLEIMPKLTKVAGFEWGTGFYINPTPPEDAARFLRDASESSS
jgi:UDPglucose--hexose-1-phosphate uridylyltransferase